MFDKNPNFESDNFVHDALETVGKICVEKYGEEQMIALSFDLFGKCFSDIEPASTSSHYTGRQKLCDSMLLIRDLIGNDFGETSSLI